MSTEPVLRPLTEADVPAWDRLLAAAEEVDRTGEHYSEDDLLEELSNPELEVGKDLVGAFLEDELVGYFSVVPRGVADGYYKLILEGAVRPDMRGKGIGTLLARAMHTRALAARTERYPDLGLTLTLTGPSHDITQERLMADVGLVPDRWNFVMRADLSRPSPEPGPVPEGLSLRRYEARFDAALLAAHNEAFRDHPNFTPWSESMWRQWVTGSRSFRPELSFVVVDESRPDEVVAYLQSAEYDAYLERTGRREAYVGKVGTLRPYRGRGLAGILLGHALGEYRAAGYDEASLDVDSDNPTGALGVYRRAGFEVETRLTNYALTLEP
jgi:mycothiol synthase